MDETLYHQFAHIEDDHWWFRGRRDIIRSLLRRWLPPPPADQRRRILDVGCGTGAMLPLLQEFGDVEGLECSSDALDYCRSRVGDAVPLHQGLLPDGIPAGHCYDLVTAFDVIEHIPDEVEALRAMRQALQPGGTLLCTVPAFMFLWGPHDDINHHYRRYTRALLVKQLSRAGFKVRRVSYFNTLLFPPIAGVRLARRVIPSRQNGGSDFSVGPPLANRVLTSLFAAERHVLPRAPLPFGVSLVAMARAA
jgi:SAM-dependent methyltransferase